MVSGEKKIVSKKVTRNDVAAQAGVSSATVSRVFNNPDSVAEPRRDAVFAAAASLGYVPNKSASALRRSGSGIITLMSFQKKNRLYYWGSRPESAWFYGEVIQAVSDSVEKTMMSLNLKQFSSPEELSIASLESDGFLCYDIDTEQEAEAVAALHKPYLIAHHTRSFSGHPRCATDNYRGGMIQAETLYKAGAVKPIYCVNYLDEIYPNRERFQGFLDRWSQLRGEEPVVLEVDPSSVSSAGPLQVVRSAAGCDSAAAVNDMTLIRFINSILVEGSVDRIGNMHLCGYDAIPMRNFFPYQFSSVDIRPKELYRRGTEMLMKLLGAGESSQECLVIEPEAAY